MAGGDSDTIFGNLPAPWRGRFRVGQKTPDIVSPPQPSGEALLNASTAAPITALQGLAQAYNAGADVAGYVGAHLAHTPLGLMAPNWHPFIDAAQTNQMAGDLAETFKNPPPIFGGGASPMSGVHALAALPAAVDATKMFKGARTIESAGNNLPNALSVLPQQPQQPQQPQLQAAVDQSLQPPQPPAGPMAAPWWQQFRMPMPQYTGYGYFG